MKEDKDKKIIADLKAWDKIVNEQEELRSLVSKNSDIMMLALLMEIKTIRGNQIQMMEKVEYNERAGKISQYPVYFIALSAMIIAALPTLLVYENGLLYIIMILIVVGIFITFMQRKEKEELKKDYPFINGD